jgi:hypothetical protein
MRLLSFFVYDMRLLSLGFWLVGCFKFICSLLFAALRPVTGLKLLLRQTSLRNAWMHFLDLLFYIYI